MGMGERKMGIVVVREREGGGEYMMWCRERKGGEGYVRRMRGMREGYDGYRAWG